MVPRNAVSKALTHGGWVPPSAFNATGRQTVEASLDRVISIVEEALTQSDLCLVFAIIGQTLGVAFGTRLSALFVASIAENLRGLRLAGFQSAFAKL